MTDLERAEQELQALLETNSELIELQLRISKKLAHIDVPEARIAFLFEEMMDSRDDLINALEELTELLRDQQERLGKIQ